MSMPMPMPSPMDNNGTMQRSFSLGTNAVILFYGWPGHNLGMYILELVMVFLQAAIVEILTMAPTLKPRRLNRVVGALVHASVFLFRVGLVYLVMLSVMSFNVGVFVVAVVGHAVGSFIVKYRALEELNRRGAGYP